MASCKGICTHFLKSLRKVRSKGSGGKDKYDNRTYNLRVVKGISIYSQKEYLRCNQCNIFLHKSLHYLDLYAYGRGIGEQMDFWQEEKKEGYELGSVDNIVTMKRPRCPCCDSQLSNRHNKQ